ncbi:MAG: phosphoglucomutase, partial [Flavobacteriales bacterium MED-G15]
MTIEFEAKIGEWSQPPFDEATRLKIMELKNKPDQLEDAFYKDLEFGTGGMRGVMGVGTNRINQYTLGKSTQGLSDYLKKCFEGE